MIRKVFGPADEASVKQLEACLAVEEGAVGALMADHHKGYSMPIGGVVAYRHHISPSGVGFDIGCGNMYAETPIDASQVDIPAVMEEIRRVISFGIGRANGEEITDHPVYSRVLSLRDFLSENIVNALMAKARPQLGTVGSGNHYVDLFENRETGKLGVGVHFGSRGLGHSIASGFMSIAKNGKFMDRPKEEGMDAPPVLLSVKDGYSSGADYEYAMNVALEYAYAGRDWVINRIVCGILQSGTEWAVHNNHNYAAREQHDSDYGPTHYVVHRKGATPAFPDQLGFVGATMGEDAAIVKGVNTPEAQYRALYSTVHGAGRAMSRTAAAGKVKIRKAWKCGNRDCQFPGVPARDLRRGINNELPKCPVDGGKLHLIRTEERVREGAIDFNQVKADMRLKGIYLVGAGADEAPGAYKRLDDVLNYHSECIKVVYRLRPLGVAMAGPDVYDPYKD